MKILLVDDHALFREGICSFLSQLASDTQFFHADNPKDAVALAQQNRPFDLVLLDYSIPGVKGLSLYFALRDIVNSTPITLLTGECDKALIHSALQAGINGYITKNSPPEIMLNAIRLVLSGGLYIPAQILDHSPLSETTFVPNNTTLHSNEQTHADVSINLTSRQQEVLEQMARGFSNKEIAKELSMSPSTVKVHVASILRELEVKNRTHAVTVAKELGLINE